MRGFFGAVAYAFFIVLIAAAGSARADVDDKIVVSAPPAWVIKLPPGAPRPGDGAVDFRLLDLQTRVDSDGLHQTFHQVVRILTPEGLAPFGNFAVAWQPGISSARLHMVTLRRDGVAIDLLGDGSGFQLLRREANLEKFQIDGVLTAVLPIRDLRVGDELETSWTLDARNPVLAGASEARQFYSAGPNFGRLFLRYSWPRDRPVRSWIGTALPAATRIDTAAARGFLIDKTDYTLPKLPEGAPARFLLNNAIEISEFADWTAVAATMRPHYESAATLLAESPIRAEVRRIATLTTDPAARATEALRVVQGQVRYFARVDGLGGYKPETADAVWAARVGDCKGKTVLLLALLRGLGIQADAALVSTVAGDGLDAALPLPSRFDHVLVRAMIAGKSYWLDGTRLGDRGIETIEVPAFKWALPLSASSAVPVRLVTSEPVLPLDDWRLDLDARAGIDTPAKVRGVAIFRGEQAAQLRTLMSAMAKDDRDQFVRKTWTERYDWIKVETASFTYDDARAEARYEVTGTGEMDWNNKGAETYFNYEVDGAQLGQYLVTKRPDALQSVAPLYVAPRFEARRQTILLPEGGRGFTLDGGAIDTEIAGVRYTRSVSLVGERFDMTKITRSREGEISYADAVAADKAVDELFKKRLFVKLPPRLAIVKSAPTTTPTPLVPPEPIYGRAPWVSRIAPFVEGGKAAKAELIAGSISDDDYPPGARGQGQQGLTVVGFDVGIDGRVSDCGIVQSSGSQILDDKTCALIRERFVYKPARAPDGKVTPSTRTQRVTWRLPSGPVEIRPSDLVFSYAVSPDGTTSDCKSTGTPAVSAADLAAQCVKRSGYGIVKGRDGKPVAARIVERYVLTIEPLDEKPAAPASDRVRSDSPH